jgi:CDP-diglyceride synthetase
MGGSPISHDMQPTEALTTSAQLAITLAGFAGVVVAFRSGAIHEWSKMDKFRLEILLSNSGLPFLLSILAMVLTTTKVPDQTTWRVCSLIAFVITVARARVLSVTYRSFSREELQTSGSRRSVFYSSAVLGSAATALQIYNVIVAQTFWPFFTMIATWLCLAMVQFVLLVTIKHDRTGAG